MNLKSFDFFRKIHTEQELSSSTGGCFTIFSLIVAAILILLSIQDFTRIQYETSLVVKNDKSESLPMEIDITFTRAPCQLIVMSFQDQLEYKDSGIQSRLNRKIIQEDGTQIDYVVPANTEEYKTRIKAAIEKKQQCRLFGILQLPKTPGTLLFHTSGPEHLLIRLSDAKMNQYVRASYILTKLMFGESHSPFEFPISHYSEKIRAYIQQLENNVYSRKLVQDFSSEEYTKTKQNFYNHMKIIPIYVDDGTYQNNGDKQKYRYSLRAGKAATNEPLVYLQFLTELEPINIMYTKNRMTWYDLSVDILAIVGGSVATIGVINSISHFLFGIK